MPASVVVKSVRITFVPPLQPLQHRSALNQMLRSSTRLFTAVRAPAAVDLNFVTHAPSPVPSANGASPISLRAPLVVFHGLLGSASNWRLLTRFPALTRDRHVIFAELRNHGTSPHADDMSWHALAADTVRLLDRIGADRCALLGHSLGGKMAMATALLHPSRIERLVVADIAPTHYESRTNDQWGSVTRVVRALAALPVSEVRDRAHADQLLAASIDDKGLRQFVLQNLQPPATPGAQWTLRCNIQALQRAMPDFATFPFDPSASRFEAPALFLSGSLSKYLTAEHRPRVREFFPAAQFDQVEGAGTHMWPVPVALT